MPDSPPPAEDDDAPAPPPLTPDEELASEIVAALLAQNLVRTEDASDLAALLTSGRASETAWVTLLERPLYPAPDAVQDHEA